MIYRVFLISKFANTSASDLQTSAGTTDTNSDTNSDANSDANPDTSTYTGFDLPPCLSIQLDPSDRQAVDQAYQLLSSEKTDVARFPISLALDIQGPFTADQAGALRSFFFLPGYLQMEGRPVILLLGAITGPPAAGILTAALSSQGFAEPIIFDLQNHPPFMSPTLLAAHYTRQLSDFERGNPDYNSGNLEYKSGNSIFFQANPAADLQQAIVALQQALGALQNAEKDFGLLHPGLFAEMKARWSMEKELSTIRTRLAATETELQNQRKYLDILRSDHPTRELQEYYDREYETLPRWYKRFGHILKVITGKRTLRSLYRDDVKKYKA